MRKKLKKIVSEKQAKLTKIINTNINTFRILRA